MDVGMVIPANELDLLIPSSEYLEIKKKLADIEVAIQHLPQETADLVISIIHQSETQRAEQDCRTAWALPLVEDRINQIVCAVQGLKYFEWCRVKIAIEKNYDSMSNRLALNDTESLKSMLSLELTGKPTL